MKPKVSILCITYNHKEFIRQALDGFVMQKTTFPFEVLVHDDASTDGTADIIREYAKQYPDIIKPIFQTENQFSKGRSPLKDFLFPRVLGEYVALNEGDDYWTDSEKLQKQVDFLDAHPDCSICFHPVRVVWQDGVCPDSIFPTSKYRFNKKKLYLSDLLKHNFIQTNSVVYRWRLNGNEQLFPSDILPGDWFLHLLHAQTGYIYCLPDIMSVYRKHSGGIWNGAYQSDKWFDICTFKVINFFRAVEQQFNVNMTGELNYLVGLAIQSFVKRHKFESLQKIYDVDSAAYHSAANYVFDDVSRKYKKYKTWLNRLIVVIAVMMLMLVFISVRGGII